MLLFLLFLSGFLATNAAQSSANTATTISTQDLAGLPICAQNCLANQEALQAQGSCSSVDIKCLCTRGQYINTIACCLDTKCSPADQQKAVSFNVNICSRVNVTIPNFLGCAVTGSAGAVGTTLQGETSAAATITGVGSVVTIASNAPVATFAGSSLLTGTCTGTMYASATLGSGTILEYPWEGCSFDNPGCCPFPVAQPGPLSVCPADYTTTGGACCPSGWLVYPSALYRSQTPCYTTPSIPLTAPITARALSPATTSIITTQLFSLRYPLASHRGLSAGAKAGIAIGVILAALITALLILFFILRRRRATKQRALEADQDQGLSPRFVGPMASTSNSNSNSNRQSGTFSPGSTFRGSVGSRSMGSNWQPSEHPISELPSPTAAEHGRPLQQSELWFPQQQEVRKEEPPVEMMGDTHLDQHHPAYSGAGGGVGGTGGVGSESGAVDEAREAHTSRPGLSGGGLNTGVDLVSPVDAPRPLGVGK